MKRTVIYLLISFFISVLAACDVINPAEKIPSYIKLNSFHLTTNYTTQGTASHKLRDAWVYVDGSFIGAYELPAKFPVLQDGTHSISIGPGIYDNGIASTRVVYPFIRYYEGTIELKAGEITTIDTIPVNYFSGVSYTWFEDFEGSGYSMDTLSNSLAGLEIDTANEFEGAKCIHMQVTTTKNVLDAASINAYVIEPGKDAYLEINYKSDQAFTVGIVANLPSGTAKAGVITFNPSSTWNKTYINLRKTIGSYGTANNFNIWFRMDLASGLSTGNAWLDNIKLIHN